jgi:Leucine-rich repeat (LRR) protein
MTEANFSRKGLGVPGAIVLAAWLSLDKGALSFLDISRNALAPLKAIRKSEVPSWSIGDEVEHGGQKGKAVYWHGNPDLCFGFCDISGVTAITHAIRNMGALLSLNLAGNRLYSEGTKLLAEVLKGNTIMTELNISDSSATTSDGKTHGETSGIMALANVIPGMGALTSLHVGKNHIPEKEIREVMAIAMHMESMKVLCEVPFKDKTLTELDLSGKNLGMEGALVVAEYLNGNAALVKFDISNNWLCNGEFGMDDIGPAIASSNITSLNVAGNSLRFNRGIQHIISHQHS